MPIKVLKSVAGVMRGGRFVANPPNNKIWIVWRSDTRGDREVFRGSYSDARRELRHLKKSTSKIRGLYHERYYLGYLKDNPRRKKRAAPRKKSVGSVNPSWRKTMKAAKKRGSEFGIEQTRYHKRLAKTHRAIKKAGQKIREKGWDADYGSLNPRRKKRAAPCKKSATSKNKKVRITKKAASGFARRGMSFTASVLRSKMSRKARQKTRFR